MVTKCIIKFCNTIKSGDGVTLHKLPSDAAVQKEWFRAILDETGQTIFSEDDVICSKHFAPSCFTVIDRKPVLNPTAIPFESLKIEGPEPKKIKREKSEAVQCGVFTCGNTLGSTDVHRPELVYHPFPKKQDLAVKWKIFCSKEDNDFEHSYVCSDHFTANDYREQKRNRGKTLKADAIPTIYKREALVDDQSESDQVSVGSGITAEPVYAPKAAPTASDMQWMAHCEESGIKVNQRYFSFETLKLAMKESGKFSGINKIKYSHKITDNEISRSKAPENLKAIFYKEVFFCCHTCDLNIKKKNIQSEGVIQCPAEIKAVRVKLGIADDDYKEGVTENALLVTRVNGQHDHKYYDEMQEIKKKAKTKKNKEKVESRGITNSIERYTRISQINGLFAKFSNIMVNESTAAQYYNQFESLQQLLQSFRANMLLPSNENYILGNEMNGFEFRWSESEQSSLNLVNIDDLANPHEPFINIETQVKTESSIDRVPLIEAFVNAEAQSEPDLESHEPDLQSPIDRHPAINKDSIQSIKVSQTDVSDIANIQGLEKACSKGRPKRKKTKRVIGLKRKTLLKSKKPRIVLVKHRGQLKKQVDIYIHEKCKY